MSTYGYFEVTRTCAGCGRALPVNGPLERVRCGVCFTLNPIPLTMYHQLCRIAQQTPSPLTAGQTLSQTPMNTAGVFQLTWGVHAPRCRHCATPLPEVPADQGDFHCPGCGTRVTNFAPPSWLRQLHPGVTQVTLGQREQADAIGLADQVTVDQSAMRPVVMRCEDCGGPYVIDATTAPVFQCRYCGRGVGIPEALWARLHPVKAPLGWYLRFESPPPDWATMMTQLGEALDAQYEQQIRTLHEDPYGGQQTAPSRFACLQLSTTCPSCEHPLPLNGPLSHLLCGKCGTQLTVPPAALGALMEWIAYDEPRFDGTSILFGVQYKTLATRGAPSCERCRAALPLVAPGTDTALACVVCGASYLSFPVPDEVLPLAGAARQVYATQRYPDMVWTGNAPASLPFDCPSCGAAVTIDAQTERIHHCGFCSTDVFVPDAIWRQLHPVEQVRRWYIDAGQVPPVAHEQCFALNVGNMRAMGAPG